MINNKDCSKGVNEEDCYFMIPSSNDLYYRLLIEKTTAKQQEEGCTMQDTIVRVLLVLPLQ